MRVGLGRPTFGERLELEAAGRRFGGVVVSMGNPHFVVDPLGEPPIPVARAHGAALERHAAFPARSNVELLRVERGAIELAVWERGAGLTEACGTGAGAAFAAARRSGWIEGASAIVRLPGGPLAVREEADGEISIEGEAVRVFDGWLSAPASSSAPPS